MLQRHLHDRDWVNYLAYDIGSAMTVGQFALHTLHDPNWLVLERRRARVPLLGETELPALYLSILAEDATVSIHNVAARELGRLIARRGLTLDLPTLRRQAPSLADGQIVKAIGRMRLSDASRDILINCVQTDELGAEVRLAAASALTRHTDVECVRTLRAQCEALNRIDAGLWGDFLVETLHARLAHEKNMKPIRATRSWQEQEAIKDHIISAFTCDHPVAFDDLSSVPAPVVVRGHADVRQALADSLVAISANLDRFSPSWSTYADTAFKLDLLLRTLRMREREVKELEARGFQPRREAPLLTEEQRARIERNISRFVEPLSL